MEALAVGWDGEEKVEASKNRVSVTSSGSKPINDKQQGDVADQASAT